MKLIAIQIALENKEFLYIYTQQSILCLDQSRQYCLMLEKAEMCQKNHDKWIGCLYIK